MQIARHTTSALIFTLILSLGACSFGTSPFEQSAERLGKLTLFPPDPEGGVAVQPQLFKLSPASDTGSFARFENKILHLAASDILSYSPHDGAVSSVAVTSDGNSMYSGSDDGSVLFSTLVNPDANLSENSEVRVEKVLAGTKPILALALSPTGRYLAVAQTSTVSVYDLESREIAFRLTRIKGRVASLSWDPREELVTMGFANGDIYIWSLIQGFFEGSGRDSLDAIERYTGGLSSIVGISYHPSGGAFFAAEQEGVISLWRPLRTEKEIGLRDRFAVSDDISESSRRRAFGSVKSKVTDLWLNNAGTQLYATGADGVLRSWKIRGLVPSSDEQLSKDELFSVTGIDYGAATGTGLLAVAGRSQRISFFCRNDAALADGVDENSIRRPLVEIARSDVLSKPASRLRAAPSSPFLWGAEKGKNLLLVDVRSLAKRGVSCNR